MAYLGDDNTMPALPPELGGKTASSGLFGMSTMTLLLIGGAAAALLMLSSKKRR